MPNSLSIGSILTAAALLLSACTPSPSAGTNGQDSAIPARRPAQPGAAKAGVIAGFAFVDSSVTSHGSKSKLPAGAKVFSPGSKITGTTGCPTTRYQTDGLMVVVIDYNGRPTSGSVAVTRHPASGGEFANAPYYLDLNPGRMIQFLGPFFENGTYDVRLTYDFSLGAGETTSASVVLARTCPAAQ